MASHIIDALMVTFSIDTKGYEDGTKEVESGNRKLKDGSKKAFDDVEQAGRKLGESIKGVGREVIGLGLAFMGARSMVGFLANLATGAASADRFGKTIGMSVKQVWAWRQAMTGFGGELSDGDAALRAVQNVRMSLRGPSPDIEALKVYSRLGISGNDLANKSAGDILSKLAGAGERMDPQLYASLLQQIGLPASTIAFLQEGKDSVDQLIKKNEASAGKMEEQAKKAEELQKALADLTTLIQGPLVEVLNQIVPLLQGIVQWMGVQIQKVDEAKAAADPTNIGAVGAIGSVVTAFTGGPKHGAESEVYSYLRNKGLVSTQAMGITAALWAESKLNPGAVNPTSGAYGIAQWLSKDRLANFKKVTGHDIKGSTLQQQLDFLWWELKGGDGGGKAVLSERGTGTSTAMINKFLRPAKGYETNRDLQDAGRFIVSHMRGNSLVIHGGIHLKTQATDAPGIARDIHGELRKRQHVVAQADSGVRP